MDKEGSMDLSGAFAKLLENPEALKSALGIASALKDSGALEGLSKATGEEYKGGESAYNEENSHEKTQRAPFVSSEERSSAPVGDDGKRRKQLLMALRPYMNAERQEKSFWSLHPSWDFRSREPRTPPERFLKGTNYVQP